MMLVRVMPTFVALLAGLALPTGAVAARPQPVGQGTLMTDGARYAAFVPASGAPARLIDTRSGTETPIAIPTPVQEQNGGTNALAAIGGGQLVWNRYRVSPVLTDISSGESREAPGWEAVAAGQTFVPFAVTHVWGMGAQWMKLRTEGLRSRSEGYLNWRTGEWQSYDPGGARDHLNLDRPELLEPLCAPFRRTKTRSGWRDVLYRRPYRIFERGYQVLLGRCGSTRGVRLFRHEERPCANCIEIDDLNSLVPTRPVWAGRRRLAPIRMYLPRKRRVITLGHLRRVFPNDSISIAQTRTRIFVTVRDQRVYWLPAPR